MGCNRQGQDITFKYPIVECEFRISCSAVGQFGFRAAGFQLIMGLRQAVGRCRSYFISHFHYPDYYDRTVITNNITKGAPAYLLTYVFGRNYFGSETNSSHLV